MNHDDAADLRASLNEKDYVEGPEDDRGRCQLFKLVRVQQPGYLNGEPMYEVVFNVIEPESFHLPTDLLELVSDRGGYLRVTGDEIHVRDWRTDEA